MANEEERRTTKVRDMGADGGLFRSCMDAMKGGHSTGQALRHASLAAGLLTDARCYAELLGQFYLATAALEQRLQQQAVKQLPLASRLREQLGYSFTPGYEADLAHLLGENWRAQLAAMETAPAREYAAQLAVADDETLCAAVFILWGPMAIGGGALILPRVKKQFGEGATHVFQSVVGGVGRPARRDAFIKAFDGLVGSGARAASIAANCRRLMSMNNDMMLAVKTSPYWAKYVKLGLLAAAAGAALAVARWWRQRERQ